MGDDRAHTTPLVDLERRARVVLPGVFITRARMASPARVDVLDVRRGDRMVSVLWTLADGFCISSVNDDSVLDDSPDFVVGSVGEALQVLGLLFGAVDEHPTG